MHVLILGTRGVPAVHGGFESFAQDLSLYLVWQGHQVTVYCQAAENTSVRQDRWQGIERVFLPAASHPWGTVQFDWAATRHSCGKGGVALTLGYNTGVFSLLYRLRGIPSVMNMDGIEWQRQKWSGPQRGWLWFNEWAGARFANYLVADHPEIARHLERHTTSSRITVIPYGADIVEDASPGLVREFGLTPGSYYLVIARAEPENSLLEIVAAYSARRRAIPLVILGKYLPERSQYHRRVLSAGNSDVKFLGAIYKRDVVRALRFHATAYLHGHRVGGTNPSLVEALAAGNPIVAHDNRFTRWVAGPQAKYFLGIDDLHTIFESLEADPGQLLRMSQASRRRHQEDFTQEKVLPAYENLLCRAVGSTMSSPESVLETQ